MPKNVKKAAGKVAAKAAKAATSDSAGAKAAKKVSRDPDSASINIDSLMKKMKDAARKEDADAKKDD